MTFQVYPFVGNSIMFCLDGSQVDVSKVDGGGGGGGEHDGHRHQSGCRASSHGGGKHRCKADFLSWPSAECPFLGNSQKGVSVYVRREIQSMLLWIKYDYVSRGSGRLRRREGLNSPS